MYAIAAILVMIACFLLILIVLVQNPKGGGLSSSFTGTTQMMGVKKTTDFLEKATWTLAIAVAFFSMVSSLTISQPEENTDGKPRLIDEIGSMDPSVDNYNFPTTAPPVEETNNSGEEGME